MMTVQLLIKFSINSYLIILHTYTQHVYYTYVAYFVINYTKNNRNKIVVQQYIPSNWYKCEQIIWLKTHSK